MSKKEEKEIISEEITTEEEVKPKKSKKTKKIEEPKVEVEIEETKEEEPVLVKDEIAKIDEAINDLKKKKSSNTKNLIIKIVAVAVVVLVLILGGKCLFNKLNQNDEISGVKKVLNVKYTDVSCLDTSCKGIMAIDGDKLKEYNVFLFDAQGKKVAAYKDKINATEGTKNKPLEVTRKYFISSVVKTDINKIQKYEIRNPKGKQLFSTDSKLSVINENFVLLKKDSKYTVLSNEGKKVYSDLKNESTYLDGEYFVIETEDTSNILNKKGEKVLDGYKIVRVLTDIETEEPYGFIVNNKKENNYSFYSLSKKQIEGDSFVSYSSVKNSQDYKITKKENNETLTYLLHKNGKQEQIEDVTKYVSTLKEKLNKDKYNIYEGSIAKANQKDIIVDNKEAKSLGVLNVDSNKYTELVKYNKDKKYFYSSVYKASQEDQEKVYVKISCSKYYCDKQQTIIYNITDQKVSYTVDDLTIGSYKEYENGYKVVYFYSLNGNKYSNKYVAFDINNKELEISDDPILIIDKKLVVGYESTYYIRLYSTKSKKILNKNRATLVDAEGTVVYRENDKNDNITLYNSKGEKVFKIMGNSYIGFSNYNYVYTEDNFVKIYNIKKDKIYKYKLKDNEKLNSISGEIIKPYNGAIFINNTNSKYAKVINFKGHNMKKIGKAEISSVGYNTTKKMAYIIVKRSTNKGDKYGLFIAK